MNLMIRYYMYPTSYELNTIDEENKLQQILETQDYDYIYLMTIDQKLVEILKNDFDLTEIEDGTLLKVTGQELEKVLIVK